MNQELYDWIEKATSKILSPQKKKEARAKLEMQIKALLEEYDSLTVLRTLGDADTVADKLKEDYAVTYDNKKSKKLGVVLLVISTLLIVIGFIMLSRQSGSALPDGTANFSTLLTPGKAIGSSFGIGIVLTVIGLKLVFTKK